MVSDVVESTKSLVLSDTYQGMINDIKEIIPIKVRDSYEDIFAQLESKRVSASGLAFEEIQNFLYHDREKLLRYTVEKFKKTHDTVCEQEGYQDSDSQVKFGDYSQGFLLANLIEFVLGRKDVGALEKYIKDLRIPNAKSYVKEVLSFMSA